MLGADVGAGGSPRFVFAPVIGGGGDTASTLDALEGAADAFFDRCDAWWESKRRVSFC
ncbi:hypothetical protein D3C75_1347200 [compost metagenome]